MYAFSADIYRDSTSIMAFGFTRKSVSDDFLVIASFCSCCYQYMNSVLIKRVLTNGSCTSKNKK
jgi:hypothetical protein